MATLKKKSKVVKKTAKYKAPAKKSAPRSIHDRPIARKVLFKRAKVGDDVAQLLLIVESGKGHLVATNDRSRRRQIGLQLRRGPGEMGILHRA